MSSSSLDYLFDADSVALSASEAASGLLSVSITRYTAGDVGIMARLSDQDVWAWAVASCAEQQVQPYVSDPATVQRVAVLILGREVPISSDPPDRLNASRVEAVESAASGTDDSVVHDGLEDGSLSGEWEGAPLSA
jgi:hypothetical protein